MRRAVALAFVASVSVACADDPSSQPDVDAGAADTSSMDTGRDASTDPSDAGGSDAEGSDADAETGSDTTTDVDAGATASPLGFDPREPGPYAAGYRSWDHTYVVPGTGEERTILVNVWYPTDVTDGDRPLYDGIFIDDFSVVDAPAAPPVGETYPVHVHSHGHRAYGGDSAFLMRHLASHGWVAVAPDHIGDLFSAYPRAELLDHYIERAADISEVLDVIAELPGDDPLSAADPSAVTMSGHSRGTYTVWANLGATYDLDAIQASWPGADPDLLAAFADGFDDPRIVAGVPMAGTYRTSWFGDGWSSVDEPIVSMTGSRDGDNATAQGLEQWDHVQLERFVWLEFEGGCHQTFALGSCGYLDVDLGYDLVTDYVLAIARTYVLADDDPDVVATAEGRAELDPVISARVHSDR